MKDPHLESELRILGLQTENWKKLHHFMAQALDKSKPVITVEQERNFTELRSILLQESGYVFEQLDLADEIAGKAMNVLQRATSIRGVRELSHDETRRLELDWNTVFTRMGVVQGQLKARRKELRSRTALTESLSHIFRRKAAAR